MSLIGDQPVQRDLLIEYLHSIQDHFGYVSTANLAALAERLRISETEVYEVASFYAHFTLVREDEAPPPPVTVRVCDGLPCAMAGAGHIKQEIMRRTDDDDVRIVAAPCMGRCHQAPTVAVGHDSIDHASIDSVLSALDEGAPPKGIGQDYANLAAYRAEGGYQVLEKIRSGELSVDQVCERVEASGLRGMGGAGFPTSRKWAFVRQESGPRYLAVNADEGEPGTFKDRHIMESLPHHFLEGVLIAAEVIDAAAIYIYVRDEYPLAREILQEQISILAAAGLLGGREVYLRRGAGAYICGEESAMLESIEGKRGEPRHKPPFPAQVGLFGQPTLINNVETLYWVAEIMNKGAAWYRAQGDGEGVRFFSVSGRVRNPGVKCAPINVTVRSLINDYCGGMADGHLFKAYLPGGASGGILPAHRDDIPLTFGGELAELGCFVGSAAIVILSDQDLVRDAALNLMHFFEDESCGQCTPCRVGTEKAAKLMAAEKWDQALLSDLSVVMRDASICGLGQAAANPLDCAMRFFPEELES